MPTQLRRPCIIGEWSDFVFQEYKDFVYQKILTFNLSLNWIKKKLKYTLIIFIEPNLNYVTTLPLLFTSILY